MLKLKLTICLLLLSTCALAQSGKVDLNPLISAIEKGPKEDKAAEYLKNFSTYFNIDVEQPVKDGTPSPDLALIENIGTYVLKNSLVNEELSNSTLLTFPFANYQPDPQLNQKPYAKNPTWQAIINLLTTPQSQDDCYNPSGCLTDAKIQQTDSRLSNLSQPYNLDNKFLIQKPPKDPNRNDLSLSLDSLLGPLNYNLPGPDTPKQAGGTSIGASSGQSGPQMDPQKIAEKFIRIATGQNNPPITMPTLRQFRSVVMDKNHQNRLYTFLNNLYNYAAMQSVSVSNLNQMYAKRIPNPKLGNLSQAQVEYQMATRRLGGPLDPNNPRGDTWHQAMEKAPPIVLQRQLLYLISEMNYQLYLSRQQNERLLATLSAIQIANSERLKANIRLD